MKRRNVTLSEIRRKALSMLVSQPAATVAQFINDTYLTHYTPKQILDLAKA